MVPAGSGSPFGIGQVRAAVNSFALLEQLCEKDFVIVQPGQDGFVADALPASVNIGGDAEALAVLRSILPESPRLADDWIRVERAEHDQFRVSWTHEEHLAPDVEGVVSEVLARLNYCHILHSPAVLHLHAGAVVQSDCTVVLSGASGAGKSTLVGALCQRGALYLTDECVDVDSELKVWAWHKPASLRAGGRALLGSEEGASPRFATFERALSTPGRTVVAVVDPSGDEGIRPIVRAAALHCLIDQSLDFGRRRGDLFWLGQFVAQSSTFVLGRFGLDEMCSAIDEVCGRPPLSGRCEQVDLTPQSGSGARWHDETEAIRLDGSLILFNRVSRSVVTVDGPTDALVSQLRGGSADSSVDGAAIDASLLESLEALGLVRGGPGA